MTRTALDSPAFDGLPGHRAGARRRILVVDDEPDIRETLEVLLGDADYEVTAADCGLAAVEAARTQPFDLLLTDLRMPGISGAETITRVKQLAPAIRVIVSTGHPTDETTADCRRRGADAFLKKPFEFDELLEVVSRLLPKTP